MVSNWEQTYIPKIGKFYVEKGYVHLLCKYVFYKLEHDSKGVGGWEGGLNEI